MKLIIDISEDDYALCKLANEATSIRLKVSDNLRFAIANGTPLDDLKKEIDKESVMHMDGEIYIRNIDVKRILGKTETR